MSFPYDIGGEFSFLNEEVKFYKNNFGKAVVLPSLSSNYLEPIGDHLTLDKSLVNYKKIKLPALLLRSFDKPLFLLKEFLNHDSNIKRNFSFKKAFKEYLIVMHYLKFFNEYFSEKKNETWIIYTYWFTPITTAATIFAEKQKNIKVISRAHGIDLYEYRNSNYIPFRKKTIECLNKLILVSEFGKKYIQSTYSIKKEILEMFSIGTSDFGILCKESPDDELSIVSCSSIDSNKRLDMIIIALKILHEQSPDIKISWNHFGDGPYMEEMVLLSKESLSSKIEYRFHGKIDNKKIIDFYGKKYIDVFITTTASEGGRPVSIAEAMCCSIPVIATNVGGIPEIVDDRNGILLDSNPEITDIVNALAYFAIKTAESKMKRTFSRIIWEQKCNANKIFPEFQAFLKQI